jgi:hypothetical protein
MAFFSLAGLRELMAISLLEKKAESSTIKAMIIR